MNWIGNDNDLGTSLEEYQFIYKPNTPENECNIIYKVDDNRYDWSDVEEKFPVDWINGKEWGDEEQIKNFLNTCGMTKVEFLELPFILQLEGLVNHWGVENIFGTCYWEGLTKENVREKTGIEFFEM